MEIFRDLALGALVGGLLGWLTVRSRYAADLAAAVAERALLRERVTDLERAAAADTETATLVAPLAAGLARVAEQVHTLERDRGDQFARVALELTRVQASTDGLRDQTASLVGSLSSANVRGAWGEVTLRRVLEVSGMLARADFEVQPTGLTRDGVRVRPDVVVHLPGDRHVAVDAKAPMSAFLEAQADGVPAARRKERLQAHARALRGHVDTLAGKGYWTAIQPSPEFVVCFVPGEAFLAAALDADPGLHEHAMTRRVVLASPATLLALLHGVAVSWQQDSVAREATELLALGRDLYTRLGALGRHTHAVGSALRRSVEAYNTLVGSMESRVLVTARRLQDLGLATEPLPPPAPVEATPRPLTAAELLAALDDQLESERDASGHAPQEGMRPADRLGHHRAG